MYMGAAIIAGSSIVVLHTARVQRVELARLREDVKRLSEDVKQILDAENRRFLIELKSFNKEGDDRDRRSFQAAIRPSASANT